MSKRSKLEKFAENLELPNVFENFSYENPQLYATENKPVAYSSHWNTDYFKNEAPLIIELACGGGEYCLGLSDLYPENNFIGVDIKGARLWRGAKTAFLLKKTQIAFIRCRIELLSHFIGKEEVDEIWITFPDPFPRPSKSNRRLSSPPFLNIYLPLLKKDGVLHLKTDDNDLYLYTLETLTRYNAFKVEFYHDDIYGIAEKYPEWKIKTTYEKKHLENKKTIKYIRAVKL